MLFDDTTNSSTFQNNKMKDELSDNTIKRIEKKRLVLYGHLDRMEKEIGEISGVELYLKEAIINSLENT